jgi:large subunit ribosomal protein L4e
MKSQLFSSKGEKKSQIELPKIFSTKIRKDIVSKYFEINKLIHPYAPKKDAGMRQSASGTISHKRHDWKGHYGRGIARVPRKTMWRRGTQFMWVGANAPGTRGGRKTHPPKGIGKEKKINKKEIKLALESAFAATANQDLVKGRYSSLEKIENIPAVIEFLPSNTKELIGTLKVIFKGNVKLIMKSKTQRAGKGTRRGRKYKSNAGVLIIKGKEENSKHSGFDIKSHEDVSISDLYPLGRITLYTKKALEELT